MALREEFEKSGNWLFRWRSYLPLLLLSLIIFALRDFKTVYCNEFFDKTWELLCLFISLIGIGIRVYSVSCVPKGTSGRNTKSQVAETLNTTGVYSVVRHPLYLGNFLIYIGIMASVRSLWALLVAVLLFWLYYERIMFAEEEFLRKKFDETYLAWSERTPAFFPNFKNWKSPHREVNWLAGIGSEYATFFAALASFTVLDFLKRGVAQGYFSLDKMWTSIFGAGLFFYIICRLIKKKTKLLNKS